MMDKEIYFLIGCISVAAAIVLCVGAFNFARWMGWI